jgi:glucosamine 6-phosphate synthetase-like amidotransferase/phosphosugar isomerase protein
VCGIAATFLTPQARPEADWQAIRENFTANLLFNELRGRAATGLIVMQADGQTHLWKEALPAREFVKTAVYHHLLNLIGPQTTLILGHTRLPTKGDPANNGNNHPIQVGTVYGVHNGRIRNDDLLFAQANRKRSAEVDSEIIFRLIAETEGEPEQMKLALEGLQGEFTFLAGNGRCPAKLLVVKHHNPLSLHYQPDWQALIFTSRYLFLRKQFGQCVSTETIPPDHLLLYDALQLAARHHQPALALPLDLNSPKNNAITHHPKT